MSTYTQIIYQVVFGSKDYVAFLTKHNETDLYSYVAGILSGKKCHPYILGGYGNHLHLVFYLHPGIPLSRLVRDIKKASHEMMKKQQEEYYLFPGWQVGYGAFTYSIKELDRLEKYVKEQWSHHKRMTFREELVQMYREMDIDFEEKYFLI